MIIQRLQQPEARRYEYKKQENQELPALFSKQENPDFSFRSFTMQTYFSAIEHNELNYYFACWAVASA